MIIEELIVLLHELSRKDSLVHNLMILYSIITGEKVVTMEDFERWFSEKVVEMNLVEGFHYSYRVQGDIRNLYVRGHVGLNILLSANNEIGQYARQVYGKDHVEIRRPD